MFTKPFPDIGDTFFLMLSLELAKTHLGGRDIGQLAKYGAGFLEKGKGSDIYNLLLLFQGLLKRTRIASKNDANVNASAKIIMLLCGLVNLEQTLSGNLQQSLAFQGRSIRHVA